MQGSRIIGGVLGVLIVLLIFIIPLPALMPALVIDILWGLNLILGLLLLPKYFLIITIFGLSIQFSFARLILTRGEAFDGIIIRALSSLILYPDGIPSRITVAIIVAILTIVIALIVAKFCTRIRVIAARFTLMAPPLRLMAIDAEYSSGSITKEEAIARRDAFQHENGFYESMDVVSKFIYGSSKISLVITAASIMGGIAIGTFLHGETIYSAMMTYMPLSLGNGFLAQFLCLMQIIAGTIAVRERLVNTPDKRNYIIF